ncbi:hypothetical protein K8R20_01325 [bacterium]|nr:hypothetical protein [bacterium]
MKKGFRQRIGSIYIFTGIVFCLIATALLAYPQLPYIFNFLSINTPEKEEENIILPIYQDEIVEEVIEETLLTLPPIDTTLPIQNILLIHNIGVNAEIQVGEDSHKALANGPWIVTDYANPESRYLEETSKSIIIASHRFGYSSWPKEKRTAVSFFSLPETKVGDSITIVWNQREYLYNIVELDQDTHIKEYDTDLILYTCHYYNSPIRIFRYANLVSINGQVVE